MNTNQPPKHTGATHAATLFLFLEFLLLVGWGLYNLNAPLPPYEEANMTSLLFSRIGEGALCIVISLLALLGCLSFRLLHRFGWEIALLAQFFLLFVTLIGHFGGGETLLHLYIGMILAIFMVGYLHQPEIIEIIRHQQ